LGTAFNDNGLSIPGHSVAPKISVRQNGGTSVLLSVGSATLYSLLVHPTSRYPANSGHKRCTYGQQGSAARANMMDEQQAPQEAIESGKDNLIAAAVNVTIYRNENAGHCFDGF
jgi:hypothetical protein